MDKQYRKHGYFDNYPEVTEGFAQALIDKKVSMLGVDSCSPDKEPYEIHKMLLGENILIAENLTRLDKLVGKNFTVIALPIKIKAEAGLARIVAGVEDI
jgi:kynurenine formamidase